MCIQDFCACTSVTIPADAPELDDVIASIKILGLKTPAQPRCEQEFDIRTLVAKGKEILTCMEVREENVNETPSSELVQKRAPLVKEVLLCLVANYCDLLSY